MVNTATRVIEQADRGRLVEAGEAGPTEFTLPTHADDPIGIGSLFNITRIGSEEVTIVPASGVTLNGGSNGFRIAQPWGAATFYKRAESDWAIAGALEELD